MRRWSWGNPILALGVVWGESSGYTNAYRPADLNPAGGEDRGLCQWSNKYWPDITDAMAYHPIVALGLMHKHSKQGTDFSLWMAKPSASALAAASDAWKAPVDPYWKLFDANIDVSSPGVRMQRPLPGPYVSTLPAAPMRPGGYPDGRANHLQRELKAEGFYPHGTDNWYGNKTTAAIIQLQEYFLMLGINVAVTGIYSLQTKAAWDGLRKYAHDRLGR